MKKLILLAGMLAVSGLRAGEEPSFGPRVNRDDQYRFFWFINRQWLDFVGKEMGLNLIYEPFNNHSYSWSPEIRAKGNATRREYLTRFGNDGVDIIDFVTASGRYGDHPEFRKLLANGKRDRAALDYHLPEVKKFFRERFRVTAEALTNMPMVVAFNALSEPYYGSPSFSKEFDELCRKELGYAPLREYTSDKAIGSRQRGDFPITCVVPKNYRPLEYFRWYWRRGQGFNQYIEDCAEEYRKVVGRDIPCAYDPFIRCPPIWGNGGKCLNLGNQWYYALPQPYGASFIVSEEMAMARGNPNGQKIFTMLQAICNWSVLAPEEKNPAVLPYWKRERPNTIYMSMPGDIMREALWTLFSRKIDGMGFHGDGAMFDGSALAEPKLKRGIRNGRGYNFTDPRLQLAVRDAFHRAGIPLGPLLRAIPERAPQAALLQCYASTLLMGNGCTFGWGCPWGDLLVGANFTPYVIYEEEIERDGIPPSVKVIIAPDCSAMVDTTAKALVDFQNRGGLIAADSKIAPAILPDFELPDLLNRFVRMERAKEDRERLKKAIPQFKRDLAPYVKPYVDSENGDLVVSARTYRSADYVFAVNDRRTFGDYVGAWGIVEEKGLPNSGTVTVARADTKAVYDLVEHREVPFRVKGGRTEFDVSYTTTDGRILLVSPRKLAPLKLRRDGDEVVVSSSDKDVMIPIGVEADGVKTRYGVVEDGIWRRRFAAGANLKVVNLATGETFKP